MKKDKNRKKNHLKGRPIRSCFSFEGNQELTMLQRGGNITKR
jgi:hypothetical protein